MDHGMAPGMSGKGRKASVDLPTYQPSESESRPPDETTRYFVLCSQNVEYVRRMKPDAVCGDLCIKSLAKALHPLDNCAVLQVSLQIEGATATACVQ
jgi:hypothetical protein